MHLEILIGLAEHVCWLDWPSRHTDEIKCLENNDNNNKPKNAKIYILKKYINASFKLVCTLHSTNGNRKKLITGLLNFKCSWKTCLCDTSDDGEFVCVFWAVAGRSAVSPSHLQLRHKQSMRTTVKLNSSFCFTREKIWAVQCIPKYSLL